MIESKEPTYCNRPGSRDHGIELADIFSKYGDTYRKNHKLSDKQQAVMFDIEHCRTSYFGYHLDICDQCGHSDLFANSCRNRHCPKCQGIAQRIWVNARLEDLLPIAYYHVTFTLPHILNPLVGYNRELIYDLLFDCASETLLQFGRDPKWLGALIGFYGILHTWGSKLWQHLHTHFIITGGGLSEDGQWVEPKYKGKFIFPVKALSVVFRGKFIQALKSAYTSGQLVLSGKLGHLSKPHNFERFVDSLVARDWVVFAKRPFAGPEKVVRYIGRYTHRIAISNSRLIKIEGDRVHFYYKDYRDDGKWKKTHLKAKDFISRFLMHVLPKGFHRIRHYGIFSNGRCKASIARIRKQLSAECQINQLQEEFNQEPPGLICPFCEKGKLTPIWIVHRTGQIVTKAFSGLLTSLPKFAWDTS